MQGVKVSFFLVYVTPTVFETQICNFLLEPTSLGISTDFYLQDVFLSGISYYLYDLFCLKSVKDSSLKFCTGSPNKPCIRVFLKNYTMATKKIFISKCG